MEEKGFYKLENDEIFFGIFILNSCYNLNEYDLENYDLPIDGWYWFENRDDAEIFFYGEIRSKNFDLENESLDKNNMFY